MTAAATTRIASMLKLTFGLLAFAADAVAIPGSPGIGVSTIEPALKSPTSMQQPKQSERVGATTVAESADDRSPAESIKTIPGELLESQSTQAQINTPCLQDVLAAGSENDAEQALCVESGERHTSVSVQFGRRIRAESGMLGQVDGLLVNYRLTNGVTLNGVAGYPVLSSKDEFKSDRQLLGISAATQKFAGAWDLSSYVMEQKDKGEADSRAVGGALRYLRPKHALLLSVDYDIGENSLSTLMISGAWKLLRLMTVSATLDVRESYLRTPQKDYLQQTLASTQGWKWGLPMERIKHLANNSSTDVKTLAMGVSYTLRRHLDLSGDIAVLDVWNDTAPDDLYAASASTNEYFYRLKLTGKHLMIRGNQSMLDLRHSITNSSRTSSASLKTKYTINRLWKISPSVRAEYRNNELSNSVRWLTSPAVKMEYRWRRQYGINFEVGGEWSTEKLSTQDKSQASYLLSLGYQVNF